MRNRFVFWLTAIALALGALWFASVQVFYYCDRQQIEYERQHAAEGK
jgi:hypothetical protein